MKHKKKKSEKHRKHHSRHKRDSKLKSKTLHKKGKKSVNKADFQNLTMASELHVSVKEASKQEPVAQDDDIIVLSHTRLDRLRNRIEEVVLRDSYREEEVVKEVPLRLEDIPLPPAHWLQMKKTQAPNPLASTQAPHPLASLVSIETSLVDLEILNSTPCSSDGKNIESLRVSGMKEAQCGRSSQTNGRDITHINRTILTEEQNDTASTDYQVEVEEEIKKFREVRRWQDTVLGANVKSQKGSHPVFSVMSYNVLAQSLLEDHPYLYRNHDPRALTWEHRSSTLLREIKEADADILCLQEVQASHLDSFYSKLKNLGYRGFFKQRTNGKVDGCALYFKADKFDLMENTTVEYYQPGVHILDRDNVAIIARLQLNRSVGKPQQIVVATTHLLYNPRRHDVKLAQTQMLLTELERVSYIGFDEKIGKAEYWPVIVTGDFNLEPYTAVYHLLTEGILKYKTLTARSLTNGSRLEPKQEMLLPPSLQVLNSCQHLGLLKQRARKRVPTLENVKAELRLIKAYNSDHERELQNEGSRSTCTVSAAEGLDPLYRRGMEPGVVSHNFLLNSVYEHQQWASNGKYVLPEATTHQKDWVTVDYIFYSGVWNIRTRSKTEGTLKLLSRYMLPTRDQCHVRIKHLPNLACGSDHLPLMAHFLLGDED